MLSPNVEEIRCRALSEFRGSTAGFAAAEPLIDFLATEIASLEVSEGVDWATAPSEALLRRVWKLSADRGFYRYMLPSDLGGAGLSLYDICAVKEAVMLTGCVLAPHVTGDLSGPPRVGHLYRHATAHQIETFLKPVFAADKAICFALTEAGAGSDAGSISTTARRSAQGWVLDGTKWFISGGNYADYAIVLAVTDPDAGTRGISAFFVDLAATGVTRDTSYEVLSASNAHANLVFKNVIVPPENLIGTEGRGLGLGMSRININRLLHCATHLGLLRLALDLSITRASRRQQFGKAIGEFQAITHMIADMATEIQAGRAMMYDCAEQIDTGSDVRAAPSMCKLFVAEHGFRVADRAMQVHGGAGTVRGHPVEAIFRKMRMFRITTGTSEIQKNTIVKDLFKGTRP